MSPIPPEVTTVPTESPASASPKDRVKISVIVPVRNEWRFIERTLNHLLAQDRDSLDVEILVVDGHSDDRTPEIVRRIAAQHSEIQLHNSPRRWSSAARNIGIRASTGDIVLIVDGHCELQDRHHLGNVVDAFETSGADCLGRPQPLDMTGASPLQKAIAAARTSRLGHHPESFIYASQPRFVPAKSVAVAYRRSVFEKVGYFDERFDAHEDGEFNYRVDQAGLRCYFAPELAVRYCPRGNLRGVFHQMVRYGKGRVRLFRKHRTGMSLGTILPALFVIGLIAGVPLSFLSPWLAGAYLAGVSIYALTTILVAAIEALKSRSWCLFVLMPLVFFAVHVGAGTGLLLEFICPKSDPPTQIDA